MGKSAFSFALSRWLPLSCLLLALLGGADMVRAAQRTALTTAGGKVI